MVYSDIVKFVVLSGSNMEENLVVVNFKTYQTAHGLSAENLAKIMENLESNARIVAVVSAFDLSSVVNIAPNLEVWTQHLDPIQFGSNTGWLHPDTAIERGAKGTLINHAEHKVSIEHIAICLLYTSPSPRDRG